MKRVFVFCMFAIFVCSALAEDVTKFVQDIGSPFKKGAYARNVWDMQLFDGKIYLGYGNSSSQAPDAKAGPIQIIWLDPVKGTFGNDKSFSVIEDQIDSIKVIDGKLVIPGTSSRADGVGSFYRLENGDWKRYDVFEGAKRVLDIYPYANSLFAVLETDGKIPTFVSSEDDGKTWTAYPEAGAERRNILFELNGLLYSPGAFVPSTSPVRLQEALFEFAGTGLTLREDVNSSIFCPELPKGYYTLRKAVNYAGKAVYIGGRPWNEHSFVPEGVFYLSSLRRGKTDVSSITLMPGNVPRDIIVSDGRLRILTDEKLSDDKFTIRVFETSDMKVWNELFSFTAPTFARSFEVHNGDFYFGLGTDNGVKGSYGKISQKSGTILKVPKEAYLPKASITYSSNIFRETVANDGAIDNSAPVYIYLTDDTFAGRDGDDFFQTKRVAVSGLPDGLVPVMKRVSPTVIEMTFNGKAASHEYSEDGTPFTITFKNTAFKGGSSLRIANAKSEKTIRFGRFVNMTLSMTDKNGGTIIPSGKIVPVEYGKAVMIRYIPAKGYVFNGWRVRKKDGRRPAIKFADNNKMFTSAVFAEDVDIVADVSKDGVVLNIECPTPYAKVTPYPDREMTYKKDSSVKISAEQRFGRSIFKGWKLVSGDPEKNIIADPSANETVIVLASDAVVKADFIECPYLLTVVNGTGSGVYPYGSTVTVMPDTPPEGMIFDKWTGIRGPNSANRKQVITLESNMTLTAVYKPFEARDYTLEIEGAEGGGTYREGATITIKAPEAAPGKMFDSWKGDVKLLGNPNIPEQTFIMPSANVKFKAEYKDAPIGEFKFSYSGVDIMLRTGALRNLKAPSAPAGKTFYKWTGADESIGDITSPETLFKMPSNDVEIKPTYRDALPANVKVKLLIAPAGAGTFQGDVQDVTEFPVGVCSSVRVKAEKGFVFDRWETNGKVTMLSDAPHTIAYFEGPANIRAVFRKAGTPPSR